MKKQEREQYATMLVGSVKDNFKDFSDKDIGSICYCAYRQLLKKRKSEAKKE